MKQTKKRAVKFLLAAFALISAFGAALTVNAAAPSLSARSVTCSENGYATLTLKGIKSKDLDKGKVTCDVKLSKSFIADVNVFKGEKKNSYCTVFVRGYKKGKTKATITIKYGKNLKKTAKLKLNIKVNKYTNPCASLKIGKKNFSSGLKKDIFLYVGKQSGKVKLSVKAKKGWKVAGIEAWDMNAEKYKKLKNNKKFDSSKYIDFDVTFENIKTKAKVDVYVFLNDEF